MLSRGGKHSNAVVETALEQLRALVPDHVVVTGDLSNLSLESEFEAARQMLSSCAPALSVIPGNHDYYTRGAVKNRRFESFFSPWMESDLERDDFYPYVKLLGDDVALVGVNSCISSPPLFAVGSVGKGQRRRIADMLSRPELSDRFIVVAIHHHLVPPRFTSSRKEYMRRLQDRVAVKETFLEGKVDLVIHGHNHQHGLFELRRPDGGTMRVSEAGSSSVASAHDEHYGGKFNLYEIVDGGLVSIETWLYRSEQEAFAGWKRWTPADGWQ
jgi:3',5'-cyclic AMP phosphodiesterase CpdA